MITINISGDFCIKEPYLQNSYFPDEVVSFFEKSDLNILNLECPIIDKNNLTKLEKTGPNIFTNKEIIPHLKKLNTHIATLANNHILDYGPDALDYTLQLCSENNINTVGAGYDNSDAEKTLIIVKNGIKIGIINFCENEWSIATNASSGANPLNTIDNFNQIKKVRSHVDFIILIVHGGHELFNLPSPRMVKLYRFFAENGADAVIGHHPHCISGYEVHNKVPIFYSLGNFLFTNKYKTKDWYTGLILQLHIDNNNKLAFSLHPTRQEIDNFKISLLHNEEKEKVLKLVDELSSIIENEHLLLSKWEQFIGNRTDLYIEAFSPINFFSNQNVRNWLKKLGLSKKFRRKQQYMRILNLIQCESHLDITINAMKKILKSSAFEK